MLDIDTILNTMAQTNPYLASNAWRSIVGFGTGLLCGMMDMSYNRANRRMTRCYLDKNTFHQLGFATLMEISSNAFIYFGGFAEKASKYMVNQHLADDLGGIIGFMCGFKLAQAGDYIIKQGEQDYLKNQKSQIQGE